AGPHDADPLPRGLGDLRRGPGAGHHGLVPDVVVDAVALTTALLALPPDEALALQEGDRLGDGRRADLQALGQFGGGEVPAVRERQTGHHPGHHPGRARRYEDGGQRLLEFTYGLRVAAVLLR